MSKRYEVDLATGESIVRDLTADEIAEAEQVGLQAEARKAEKNNLLEKLGLTEDEFKLLLS